ncbi:hypothetical protein [Clostridium sp. HBUAS56017]|uniref:hypothetical protein n=1 Tax=Clostridium sp. HBUAS56017 TaxID=2571128 RepID=UPI001A9C243C|nr:hypothetical protein [Clostridium sp. HBUAS56017]
MKVNKNTINKLDDFNLHDSELIEVCSKYDDNIATFFIDHFFLKKKMIVTFKEVLYTEITSIKLWGGGGYLIYRGVRMIPSLLPPLWWTIPANAVCP